MAERMKCALVEGPGRLIIGEVPVPRPGKYEVLCRLKWAGTCTATDQHIIEGRLTPAAYPLILGHESVGEVVELGEGVTSYRLGDHISRVGAPAGLVPGMGIGWGGYSEYGIAVDHWAMARDGMEPRTYHGALVNQIIPADVSLKECAMLTTWRETLSFIQRMGVKPGSRILVIGSGGNGLSFVRHGVNLGAEQVACAGSALRCQLACELGAAAAVDYRDPEAAEKLRSMGRFDMILDAVGADGSMDPYLPLLTPGGTVAVYGIEAMGGYRMKPLSAPGSFSFYQGGYREDETHQQVINFMRRGMLCSEPFMGTDSYSLEELPKAFDDLKARKKVKACICLDETERI